MPNFFAKNILFLRKAAGYTQAEMPNYIDITRGTWGNYENNVSEPDIEKIILISQLFGVSISDLLTVNMAENVQLNENSVEKKLAKNVQLNVQPNVMNTVNEPDFAYETAKKQQVDLLILKQVNSMAEDIKKISEKLGL